MDGYALGRRSQTINAERYDYARDVNKEARATGKVHKSEKSKRKRSYRLVSVLLEGEIKPFAVSNRPLIIGLQGGWRVA